MLKLSITTPVVALFALLCANISLAQANIVQTSGDDCQDMTLDMAANDSTEPANQFPQTLCLGESQLLGLNYRSTRKGVTLQISRKNLANITPRDSLTVQRISPQYKAQSANLIGWLPRSLQTGLSAKRAYYLFSKSSKTGKPAGQCGTGSEIILGIVDFSGKQLRHIGELPVSSCLNYIDPADNGSGHIFDAFSTTKKGLKIAWLGYSQKLDGNVYGTLAPEANSFEFHHDKQADK